MLKNFAGRQAGSREGMLMAVTQVEPAVGVALTATSAVRRVARIWCRLELKMNRENFEKVLQIWSSFCSTMCFWSLAFKFC